MLAAAAATGMLDNSVRSAAPLKSVELNLKSCLRLDEDTQRAWLELGWALLPGQHVALTLRYSADLGDEGTGFFRFQMQGRDGRPRWMGATQFVRPPSPCLRVRAYPIVD